VLVAVPQPPTARQVVPVVVRVVVAARTLVVPVRQRKDSREVAEQTVATPGAVVAHLPWAVMA